MDTLAEIETALESTNAFISTQRKDEIEETISKIENMFTQYVKKNATKPSCKYFCDVHESGSSFFFVVYKDEAINLVCLIHGKVNPFLINALLTKEFPTFNVQSVFHDYVPYKFLLKNENVEYSLVLASIADLGVENPHEIINFKTSDMSVMNRTCFKEVHNCRILSYICDTFEQIDFTQEEWRIFHSFLKIIKLWAKTHRIHNGSLGYLDDIVLIILVTKIHLLHREADLKTLLDKFFQYYTDKSTWEKGVSLHKIKRYELNLTASQIISKFKIDLWDPLTHKDKLNSMPVVAPVFPMSNLTSKMTISSCKIIQKAFEVGLAAMNSMESDKFSSQINKLFVPTSLIPPGGDRYMFILHARTKDLTSEWIDSVETNLNAFTHKIEEKGLAKSVNIIYDPKPLLIRLPLPKEIPSTGNEEIKYQIERKWYVTYDPSDSYVDFPKNVHRLIIRYFTSTVCKCRIAQFAVDYTDRGIDEDLEAKIIDGTKDKAFPFEIERDESTIDYELELEGVIINNINLTKFLEFDNNKTQKEDCTSTNSKDDCSVDDSKSSSETNKSETKEKSEKHVGSEKSDLGNEYEIINLKKVISTDSMKSNDFEMLIANQPEESEMQIKKESTEEDRLSEKSDDSFVIVKKLKTKEASGSK